MIGKVFSFMLKALCSAAQACPTKEGYPGKYPVKEHEACKGSCSRTRNCKLNAVADVGDQTFGVRKLTFSTVDL